MKVEREKTFFTLLILCIISLIVMSVLIFTYQGSRKKILEKARIQAEW